MRSVRTLPRVVTSNGREVPFDDVHFAPMRDGTTLIDDPSALRERLREDGYLLLRGVLDREDVLAVRDAYFRTIPADFLAPGTTAAEGIFSGHVPDRLPPHGVAGHPAHAFVRSTRFAQFCASPRLGGLAQALLDGPADLLPRRILRHYWRTARLASRAHTDYDYMRRGSDRFITLWIPIGDCPVETGGLVYLEGGGRLDAHQLRRLRTVTDRTDDPRPISHDLAWTARETGRRWLWTDFRAGDVAVHSPHIAHASLDTCSDAMRLSADVRFHRRGERVDDRWTQAWSSDDGA